MLPAGQAPPAVTIDTARLAAVLNEFKVVFRWVLIDGGSVPGPFGEALLNAADASVLVVRLGQTDREEAQSAVQAAQTAGGRLIGCLITNVPAAA
jgi:hypothetical protein